MSGPKIRRPGELAFICVLTGFSAIALWQAWLISGFEGLSTPGVFPMLAAASMLFAGLFILRDTLRAKPVSEDGGVSNLQQFLQEVVPARLVIVIGLVTVYLLSMPWLGFVISSAIFLFITFAVLWRKGIVISMLLAIGSLAFVYFLFRIIFQVVLPQGSLIPPGVF